MANFVKIVYASTLEEGKEWVIKNRVTRYINALYERYCLPEDDVSKFVFHYDRRDRQVYRITVIDSGIGRGGFQSNLDYEGQITTLVNDLDELKNKIQGHKMREGRYRNKVAKLEQEIKELEKDRSSTNEEEE